MPASRPQHRGAGSRRAAPVCERMFELSRAMDPYYRLGNEGGKRYDEHRRSSAALCPVREGPPAALVVRPTAHAAGTTPSCALKLPVTRAGARSILDSGGTHGG